MPKKRLPDKNFDWTPQLAYVIGLLVTDGNLSGDGRHISLNSAEIEMVKTFSNCLNLKNRIGKYFSGSENLSYRLQFGSVQFYNWLLRIGLMPAKTYDIGEILIPDEFFIDFIRGHLDGDGSIRFYNDNYNIYRERRYNNLRLYVSFISASKVHIEWLRNKIIKNINIKGALIKNTPRNIERVPIWEIRFAKKESIKLLEWIYYKADLPCLIRKRDLAKRAMMAISNEKRVKYTRIDLPTH